MYIMRSSRRKVRMVYFSMKKGQLLQQLMLLRSAIGNVIDNNPNVCHITMNEIHEWIDDILAELK